MYPVSAKDCKYIECAYWHGNGIKRNIFTTVDKAQEFLEKHLVGSYFSAYTYDQIEDIDQAYLYGDFYMDFDKDMAAEDKEIYRQVKEDTIAAVAVIKTVYGIMPEEMEIYFSGAKGIHLIVPAEIIGVTPLPHLNEIYRLMACDINSFTRYKTADLRVYDRRRLLRAAGSVHQKTYLFKTRLTYEELKKCEFEDIIRLAQSGRIIEGKKPVYNLKAAKTFQKWQEIYLCAKEKERQERSRIAISFTPPCIETLLSTDIYQGSRNNTAIILCSHYYQRGYDSEDVILLLSEWNKEHCQPPLNTSELKNIVRSVYLHGYTYGCNTIKTLGVCSDICKFAENKGGNRFVKSDTTTGW